MSLVDSGASCCVVRQKEFLKLCKDTGRKPIVKKTDGLVGVTGHELKVWGETQIWTKQFGPVNVVVIEEVPYHYAVTA